MYDLCTECIYYHLKTLDISAKPLKFKTQFSLLRINQTTRPQGLVGLATYTNLHIWIMLN